MNGNRRGRLTQRVNDPQLSLCVQLGAVPQSHPGSNGEIGVADQLGRFAWYELLTTDVAAAGAFYRKVVGWGVTDESTPELPYTVLRSGGIPLGGLMDIPEEGRRSGATPRWMGYVAVDDLDRAAAQIGRLEGAIFVPPTDTNIGRIAVAA
ncbi:MAG TPA: VOC family protein, partial [Pseudolabrys sp.]|nr:VOC family protein [Pseudolabrys sp.]